MKNEIRIVLDEACSVAFPRVHDANIFACYSVGDGFILLTKCEDGKLLSIFLRGVIASQLDNFRTGNIILDMTVESGTGPSYPEEAKLLALLGAAKTLTRNQYIDNIIADIKNSKFRVVTINPSYGLYLYCICHGVEMSVVAEREAKHLEKNVFGLATSASSLARDNGDH